METTEHLPTECLVCTNDEGHVVLTECPNHCDNGLIYPDDEPVFYGEGSGWTGYSTGE